MMSQLEEELDLFEHGWKAPDQHMRYVFTNNYWLRHWHSVWILCIDALLISFTLRPSTLSRCSLKMALSWNQIFQWMPHQISTKTQRLLMCLVTLLGCYGLLLIRCVVIFSARCGTPQVTWVRALWLNVDLVQVQLSLHASFFFFKCCAEKGLPCLELIKYVQMCWSSMYDLLKWALLLKGVSSLILLPSSFLMSVQGITKFIQLTNNSTQVPMLQKKCYTNYRLSPDEWTKLGLLHQILKVQTMSHNLNWSGSNSVKTAFCPHSTSVLFQTCSHHLLHFPNH